MTHGSLFSGIGGFDLAAEWVGWENIFHCENNKFCQKILKQHFPNSIGYDDIKTTDFKQWNGKIDVVSGGFPCQPFSVAGKRKGTADDRHLWPEMLRAIREIQPRWVVGENVRGLTNWNGGLVFDQVQLDLEAENYEVLPFLLPACALNAPHRRDRIWIVAYDNRYFGESEYGLQTGRAVPKKWVKIQESSFANTICTDGEKIQTKERNSGIGPEPIINSQTRRNRRWENWPSQHPIHRGNDGISNRMDRIKALGNAIVPQVAFQIFKAIQQFEIANTELTRTLTLSERTSRMI